jgi:hypothetical protein
MLGAKMVGFYWVVGVLSLLGLLLSWSGPYAQTQDEQSKGAPTAHNADSDPKIAKEEGDGQSSGWRKYKEKIERNEKFITATSTIFIAAFTVLLAFATFFLWSATLSLVEDAKHSGEENSRNMQAAIAESKRSADAARDAVGIAERTAERQLRAYVGLVLGHVLINEPEAGKIQAWIRFKNHGLTPAYKVRVWFTFSRMPTDSDPFSGVGIADNEAVLPPGGVATVTATLPNPPGAMESVKNGTYSFYIWGRVEYVDAFDSPRYVNFRGIMSGPPGTVLIDDAKLPGWGFQPTKEGNHQD